MFLIISKLTLNPKPVPFERRKYLTAQAFRLKTEIEDCCGELQLLLSGGLAVRIHGEIYYHSS
tara:strand:- start:494 stop:682 length:189 start_codon:yes stop_codon:yes gene_type:complete